MARRVWYNSLSFAPKGVEDESGREWRHGLLRKIGYKIG